MDLLFTPLEYHYWPSLFDEPDNINIQLEDINVEPDDVNIYDWIKPDGILEAEARPAEMTFPVTHIPVNTPSDNVLPDLVDGPSLIEGQTPSFEMFEVVLDPAGYMQKDALLVNDNPSQRFRFSEEVLETLLRTYREQKYPKKSVKRSIATNAHVSIKQVEGWFKNRRNRDPDLQALKMQAGSSVAPSVGLSRTSPQRYLSSSNSCNSMPSSVAQSCENVFTSQSLVGRKRKFPELSYSGSEVESSPDSTVKYQCTVCCRGFTTCSAWKRHEESKCLLQRLWTCLGKGWRIDVERSESRAQICVFCSETDPLDDHIGTCRYRIADCLARPIEERQHHRKDYLKRHLSEFHQVNLSSRMLDKWESSQSEKDWTCGFCGEVLPGWQIRAAHIALHYREGFDMYAWNKFKKASLQSISFGAWSFVTLSKLGALTLTYTPSNGLITYTMVSASGRFSMQYSIRDIQSIATQESDEDTWLHEGEEAFVVELSKAPLFRYQASDAAHSQQCGDFTEGSQATLFSEHTLVGLQGSAFSSIMRHFQGPRNHVWTRPLTEESIVSPPSSILLGSSLSRFCPFCYISFPRGCGKVSHSIYSACFTCGKQNWNGHECIPPPERVSISTFTCKVTSNGGRTWGCGARFNDYLSLWMHLSLDMPGSECRAAMIEENEKEDKEFARMFEQRLNMNDGQEQQRSEGTTDSSTATVTQHPHLPSLPSAPQPPQSRLIFPTESQLSSTGLDGMAPIFEADSTGQFRDWVSISPEDIGVSPAESGDTVSSGKSFNDPWVDEEVD